MGDRIPGSLPGENSPRYKGFAGSSSKLNPTLPGSFAAAPDGHAVLDYYPGLVKVSRNTNFAEEEEEDPGDDEHSEAVSDAHQVAIELDRAAALLRKPDAADNPMRDGMGDARIRGVGAGEGSSQPVEAAPADGDDIDRDEFAVTVADPGPGKAEERVYRQGVWSLNESIILLDAKKREREILSGSKRNSISADEKWKAVAEFCWSHGVHRSKEQCRFKWENTMPDFKKVRDYEYEKAETDKSYFEMENWQRKEKHLPPNLSKELYTIMDSFQAGGTTRRVLGSAKREVRERMASRLGISSQSQVSVPEGDNQEAAAGDAALVEGERDKAGESKQADEKSREAEGRGGGRRKRRRVVDSKAEELAKGESQVLQAPPAAEGVKEVEGIPAAGRVSDEVAGAVGAVELLLRVDGSTLNYGQSEAGRDHVDSNVRLQGGGGLGEAGGDEKNAGLPGKQAPSAEDRKDARHRELVALEREKLVANKEAMGLVASALNNVATAFVRMAELLQQR